MSKIQPSHQIYLADSTLENAGRGVFAASDIKSCSLIETCPVIRIEEPNDYKLLKQTNLRNYYFLWPQEPVAAICLGFGSLYNHSYKPNATYTKNINENTITFTALRDIDANEEITVNYNYGNPDDKSPLWMPDVPPPEVQS